MSDQSDGPLSEEHVWTHSLLTKPDGWRTISILVQSACLVLYLRSVLSAGVAVAELKWCVPPYEGAQIINNKGKIAKYHSREILAFLNPTP